MISVQRLSNLLEQFRPIHKDSLYPKQGRGDSTVI
nr:MAG TPA: hypothetical protein [Caudoviricetes sp.]DAT64694.1 MAG TPA: hypothetical protein [Caudoviricetes sp.]